MMILNTNPDKLKVEWKLGDLFWGRVGGGGVYRQQIEF